MTPSNTSRSPGAAPILAGVLCVMLVVPAGALAQQGWTGIINPLSPLETSFGASALGADGSGHVIAAWSRLSPAGDEFLESRRYSRTTGLWSGPTTIALTNTPLGDPQIVLAVNAGGEAFVLWTDETLPGPLRASRFDAAMATWSAPASLSARGVDPRVAIDDNGNGIAAWIETSGATPVVTTSRYDAATSAWSAPTPLSATGQLASSPDLAAHPDGDAFAIWLREDGALRVARSARYDVGTGLWTAAATVSDPGGSASHPQVAIDNAGNAFAIWMQATDNLIQTSRYSAQLGFWDVPRTLSSAGDTVAFPDVAAMPMGDALAVWVASPAGGNWTLRSSSYASDTDEWIAEAPPPVVATVATPPRMAMDPAGHATIAWMNVQTARRSADGVWSTYTIPGQRNFDPAVAVDPVGNATVVWRHTALGSGVLVETTQWSAAPAAPTNLVVAPGDSLLLVGFDAPPSEAGFRETNYEYSVDGGGTWTTRSPESIASPIVISGLMNGTTYTVRLRAVNQAGPGAASVAVQGTPAPAPLPPQNLSVVSIAGTTVTLRWTPPTVGTPPTGYVVEGGLTPGSVLGSLPTGSPAPIFTFSAPVGVFFIRVHALAGVQRSAPSNELPIAVGVPLPPASPTGLLGLADGSSLTLAWQNTFSGAGTGAPTGLVLDVTGTISTSVPLPLVDRFTFAGVPAGTYQFAVRATNGSGASAPSNTVTLTFPGTCTAPSPPTDFAAARSGSTVFISWRPPADGAAPSSYVLIVRGSFVGTLPTTEQVLTAVAPPGTYVLSAAAVNSCGTSAETPAQTIAVP